MTKSPMLPLSTRRAWIRAGAFACLSVCSGPVFAADAATPASVMMPAAGSPALASLVERGDRILQAAAWHSTEGQGGSSSCPVIIGEQVVVSPTPGGMAGLDPTTGRIKWRARVGPGLYGDDATVLAADSGGLRAVNAWDATPKWRMPLSPGANRVGYADNGRVPAAVNLPDTPARAGAARPDGPPELRLFNVDTGEVLWKYPLADATDARAIAVGKYVCLSVQQLTQVDGKAEASSQYQVLDGDGKALTDVDTGLQRASLQDVAGGVAVLVGSGAASEGDSSPAGQVVVLDAETGAKLWSARLPISPDYSVSFPPIEALVTDDLLLVSYVGNVRATDCTRGITAFDLRTGRQRWSLVDATKSPTAESMARFLQPLVCKDLVIVGVMHESDNSVPLTQRQGLLAISAKTGQPQWLIHTGADGQGATMDAEKLYFATAYPGSTKTDLPTGIFAIPLKSIPPGVETK